MSKVIVSLLILFYIVAAVASSGHAAANLAKGKPYTVSPLQNYEASAPADDVKALTDGKYSVGYYWAQKTTVGWQSKPTVEILLDLEKDSDIGSVVFSTARGEQAGVYYPEHVAVFIGPDREHLRYAGDLADDPDNKKGPYQIRKFMLNNVGIRGRYVLLEAIPKGVFLFCDEIEVLEGTSGTHKSGAISVKKARRIVEKMIHVDGDGHFFNQMLEGFANPDLDRRGLSKPTVINGSGNSVGDARNTEDVEIELLAIRGRLLRNKISSKSMYVKVVNPWAPLNPFSSISQTAPETISLVMPRNGYDAGAALITNLSANPFQVETSLDRIPGGPDLSLYQVPFIKTAAMEQVADPLVPAKSSFNLRPGESRLLFVLALGKQSGNWKSSLQIKYDGGVAALPITAEVSKVELPGKLTLNAINWSDLDFKLIRDRQKAAVSDLLAHHTNAIDVPPAFLPTADPVKPLDFSQLESYLKSYKGVDKVFLFTDLGNDTRMTLGGRYPFMGEPWKIAMKKWYDGAKQASIRAGFKADQIYWYPFDEMHGKQIDQFVALAQWARSAIPGVRFYATLGIASEHFGRALPYLDIVQVANNPTLLKNNFQRRQEIWLYDTQSPAKSLSPYAYYRMMAWQAFVGGYKGIGFWAYADTGYGDNPGTAWDDFDGKRPDYAVIYEGAGDSIISSRRWEAWRTGIEDYELLGMYAKAKGYRAAKALAQDVLDHPEDSTRADRIRRTILKQF